MDNNSVITSTINEHKKTFLKFIIIGLLATVVNYSVFFILFKLLNVNYIIAYAIGYISGVVVGFRFNRSFTFNHESKTISKEAIKYLTVYTISLFLGMGVLKLLVEFGKITIAFDQKSIILIANIFTIGFTTITNYIGTRFYVFPKKQN